MDNWWANDEESEDETEEVTDQEELDECNGSDNEENELV